AVAVAVAHWMDPDAVAGPGNERLGQAANLLAGLPARGAVGVLAELGHRCQIPELDPEALERERERDPRLDLHRGARRGCVDLDPILGVVLGDAVIVDERRRNALQLRNRMGLPRGVVGLERRRTRE